LKQWVTKIWGLRPTEKQTQANPNKANPTPIFRPLSHPKPKAKPSKPKQTQPVVSLSNLPVVSLPNPFIAAHRDRPDLLERWKCPAEWVV